MENRSRAQINASGGTGSDRPSRIFQSQDRSLAALAGPARPAWALLWLVAGLRKARLIRDRLAGGPYTSHTPVLVG